MKEKKDSEDRDLVICNNCLWAVSLLKGSKVFNRCPACDSMKMEIIPVEEYEDYKIWKNEKTGLSIEFTGNA